ncbi:LSU ribosomal protein L30P [Cryptobacterium curtum DSM 15641]|uniref:Large ribosomal subunit protein uL30 n=1 Tax=Cryptobacterium curtum (strain ATCC 700683 / DSM 15641 / CCUG 43107 / 12-3) TaxID=469378 RepID=C7MP33_CRYCD|nr:50S ribosomal protein L30 [Cryptobacterium curtum]ACU94673.1 LSU ribosomal protein L30P [Cryptobacterium curtum DSM 15641]
MASKQKMLHVKQVRSTIGRPATQERTLKGMGLGRIGKERDLPDNESTRGMIFKVKHLVEVTEA